MELLSLELILLLDLQSCQEPSQKPDETPVTTTSAKPHVPRWAETAGALGTAEHSSSEHTDHPKKHPRGEEKRERTNSHQPWSWTWKL